MPYPNESDVQNSQVDPVLNIAWLSDIQPEDMLTLLSKRRAPAESLPTFLHEATHHWCFRSPVGSSLAFLQMRARRDSLLFALDLNSSRSAFDVAEDVRRYESATYALRPLAEGLALFAQFDVEHGGWPGISIPMSNAAVFYGDWHRGQGGLSLTRFRDGMHRALFEARLAKATQQKKVQLLATPINYRDGGYLPGYLAVRNLWLHACGRTEHFADSDLFLTYLRRFFYCDLGLVNVLLDPGTSGDAWVKQFRDYLAGRFEQFLQVDLAADVEEYLHGVEKETRGEGPDRDACFTPLDVRVSGEARLEESLRSVCSPGGIKTYSTEEAELLPVQELLRIYDNMALARRSYFHLCSTPASVEVTSQGKVRARVGDTSLQELPALAETEAGVAAGSIELILSMSATIFHAACILRGAKVVAIVFNGSADEAERERFHYYAWDRDQMQEVAKQDKDALHALMETAPVKERLGDLRERVDVVIEDVYNSLALLQVKDKSKELCLPWLYRSGLLGVLKDKRVVQGTAALSLLCAFGYPTEAVAMALKEIGFDYASLVESLRDCEHRYGIRLLVETQEYTATSI